MIKHSKRIRGLALKSLIVLAVLMMALGVVPSKAKRPQGLNKVDTIYYVDKRKGNYVNFAYKVKKCLTHSIQNTL